MNTQKTPTVAGKKLSSSLKNRLKSCGRYHASPLTGARQPRVSPSASNFQSPWKQNIEETNYNSATPSSPQLLDCDKDTVNTSVTMTSTPSLPQRSRSYRTPLTGRSRTSINSLKGSKLDFNCSENESTSGSSNCLQKSEKIQTKCDEVITNTVAENSSVQTSISSNKTSDAELVRQLKQELKEQEEHLRKLKMVKMYRSKNNLEELETLIGKWRDVTQQALQDLHEALPEPKPTLTELINHLQVDHHQVGYDPDAEGFN